MSTESDWGGVAGAATGPKPAGPDRRLWDVRRPSSGARSPLAGRLCPSSVAEHPVAALRSFATIERSRNRQMPDTRIE